MNNKNIKKMAVTLAAIQALTLSGCKSNNVENVKLENPVKQVLLSMPFNKSNINVTSFDYHDIDEEHNIYDLLPGGEIYNADGYKIGEVTEYKRVYAKRTNSLFVEVALENGKTVYVSTGYALEVPKIDVSNLETVNIDKEKVLNDFTYIYDSTGRMITSDYNNSTCTAIASNGEYTFVVFPNGVEGFVKSENLSSVISYQAKHAYIRKGTKIYSDKTLTMALDAFPNDQITYVFLDDGNFAYVGNPDYREAYYIESSALEYTEDFKSVYNYGYIKNEVPLYSNKELTEVIDTLDPYSLVYAYDAGTNDEWIQIYDYNHGNMGFVRGYDLEYVYDDFIDVDLGDQHVRCYLDNINTNDFYTRTGKDSTPTHTGVFDIDWKAENWEFTTYPGSYAKHWIPYNEYGEGFHDLVGDDEQNYGGSAYHTYGSHGCVRVPAFGSEYIYDNYEPGDLVLVHK